MDTKWIVIAPREVQKKLKYLPIEVGKIFKEFITDLRKEGPFPKGWQVEQLKGSFKKFLKAKIKRNYRVIYHYESELITIFIEKVSHRKDIYRRKIWKQ